MATGGIESASDEIINIQCSICSAKNIIREAQNHCVECQAFYCIPCSDMHKMFPLMKGHKLLDKTSFGSQQLQSTVPCFPTDVCSVHKARLLDMFCRNHDEIVCATCVALNHRTCKDIHSIPDEVDMLYQRSEIAEVSIKLNAAKKVMEDLKETKKDSIIQLLKNRNIANSSIRSLRKEMEATLEELEKESLREVAAEYRKNEAFLQEQIKEIESLTNDLEHSADRLKSSDGNKAQEFVCFKASITCIQKTKEAESNLKNPCSVALEFVTDSKIKIFLQEAKTLGQIITEKSIYTEDSNSYSVKNQRKVCVKQMRDVNDCRIFGSCFTKNGALLVADTANEALKLVDISTDCIKGYLAMTAGPVAVCLADIEEAAVSLNNKAIQFVSFGDKLSAGRIIKLNHYCFGLAYKDEKLFMTDQGKTFYIYDKVGTMLHKCSASTVLHWSRHLGLSSHQDEAYVVDHKAGLVTFDLQGNYQSCLSFPDVPKPQGVCVDGRGNIFICGWGLSSVLQIGEQSKTTLGVLAEVRDSLSICFDAQQNILVVSEDGKSSVTVIELE